MPLLITLVLVGHAVMHVGAVACGLLFVSTPPSIVAGMGVDFDAFKAIAVMFTSVTVAGYVCAALAGAGILPRNWWSPLVLVASIASATLLVCLFSPACAPGLAIDAVLVSAVLARSWQPSAILRGRE